MESIEILVTDIVNEKETNVTNNFEYYNYGDYIKLDKTFEIISYDYYRYYHSNSYDLEMIKTENIPDKVIFTVHITLQSGKVLTSKTDIINFVEIDTING